MTSAEILSKHEDLYRKECETLAYRKGINHGADRYYVALFVLFVSLIGNLLLGMIIYWGM